MSLRGFGGTYADDGVDRAGCVSSAVGERTTAPSEAAGALTDTSGSSEREPLGETMAVRGLGSRGIGAPDSTALIRCSKDR